MHGIIYCAHNTINDKLYIGQTVKTLGERRISHESAKQSKRHYFQNALNDYGFDNFNWSVMYYAQDKESLDDAEKYWIESLDTTNRQKGYNLRSGGANGIHSEISKNKMSELAKKREPMSEETRKKISETLMGHTPWNKGKITSKETKEKQSMVKRGKKASEETKLKMSIAHSNMSEETRKKISEASKKQWAKRKALGFKNLIERRK